MGLFSAPIMGRGWMPSGRRLPGVFPLVTSIPATSRGKRQILEIYKYQSYIEKRFALTTSEYAITPIFLKKPSRVVGLLHVYFVAIMLSALLERQARNAMAVVFPNNDE